MRQLELFELELELEEKTPVVAGKIIQAILPVEDSPPQTSNKKDHWIFALEIDRGQDHATTEGEKMQQMKPVKSGSGCRGTGIHTNNFSRMDEDKGCKR